MMDIHKCAVYTPVGYYCTVSAFTAQINTNRDSNTITLININIYTHYSCVELLDVRKTQMYEKHSNKALANV